jgi:putative inorganic carbon (HCO3(-)) transporter
MTYYALLLFFLVEYVRPGNFVPGVDALKLNLLVPVSAIIGTFVRKSPVSNRDLFAEPNTAAMIVFLGLLCVSTLLAVLTSNAFEVTKNVFAYVLIYTVLVRQLGSLGRIKGVFATLIGVHVIAIGVSPNIFADSSGRASVSAGAFLGDGNDFSLSVNICLPLCLFLLQEARKKLARVLWLSTTILLVMAIIATKSRGGTIALVVIGLYFWLKSRRKLMTAVCVLAAAAIIFVSAPPAYFNRMATMTDTEESSAQGRITAWKTAVSMAADSPLLGAGAGHFPSAFGTRMGGRWMTAHSIYFLLLGELGIPGISVLLFLIFYNIAANRRLQRNLKPFDPDRTNTAANLLTATSAAMLAFAVAGTFLSAAYYPHLYIISGLAAASRYVVRQDLARLATADTSPQAVAAAPASIAHGAVSPAWRPRVARTS